MSLYAISLALGYVVGPLLASLVVGLGVPAPRSSSAGGLAVLAVVVVLLGLEQKAAGVRARTDARAGRRRRERRA